MKAIKMLSALLIFSMLFGCSKDDAVEEPARSSENKITNFQFLLADNPFDVNVIANIDEENKTISFNVPDGAQIIALLPSIEVSPNATYSPQGAQNFTQPVNYTVTAEDGTSTTYSVKAVLSQKHILMAIYNSNPNNTLNWDLDSADIGSWEGVTLNENQKVSELDFDFKNLDILPYEIGQLSDLKQLLLGFNNLTELPPEIGQLTSLIRLRVVNNGLITLPSELGQLTNLTTLTLRNNELTEIPSEIGELLSLTSFDTRYNNLTEIPSEIGQLTDLTSLYISYNSLVTLPPELGQLTNLTSLDISSNDLVTLPPELGQLTNLTWLDIYINNLATVPLEIGQLTNLTRLSLSYNSLTEIPSTIGQLNQLEYLYLNNNSLTSIPQVVCDFEANYGTQVVMDSGVVCE